MLASRLVLRLKPGSRLTKPRPRTALFHSESQHREEPLGEYRPGGFHAMAPGETVGEYEVVRKLGWGQYSMVWQVKSLVSGRPAAMKVMKAELTDIPELHESAYLHRILTANPTHPGFPHNLHLLADFYTKGPNGTHSCFVTELLGESLYRYSCRFPKKQVPIAAVKNILSQVIKGMMYLHDECNIIHTDIKAANILLTLPEVAVSSDLSPTTTNVTVKLIDVGVACWADRVDDHFTDLIHSPELRAPEVVVGAGWGKPSDIWSLGCLLFELTTGRFLLDHDTDERTIPFMHAFHLGLYPDSLTMGGKYSHLYFKEDGSELYDQPERYPLADVITDERPLGDPDNEGLIQFLDLILCLDPRKRASLQTLLEHPWLTQN